MSDDWKPPPTMTEKASRAAAAQLRAALRRRGILSPKFRGSSRICRTCVKDGVRVRAPWDVHVDIYLEALGDDGASKIARTIRRFTQVREAAAECGLVCIGPERLRLNTIWRLQTTGTGV